MNIEEASTAGNAEVIEAILKELKLDTSQASFTDVVKLIAGDQLSIARLRSVAATRAGNEGGSSSLQWAVFVPGLFHYKIAATWHYGRSPGSHKSRHFQSSLVIRAQYCSLT
ncbi:hypothetical protein BJ138DRAFT_1162278 [Hygrophoropsis aurantiaca]|uniref:Uncharacterized protein n=1 Tax=Hygrophoropsis aurantiaca TaxID=72124 RepID=A0ACB8A0F3_9AGAM|nr:hypothetical protein BJ138DRAFT_1162278 [Hygrophoropsis aurantiaca]